MSDIIEVTKKCFDKLEADGHAVVNPEELKKLGYPDKFIDGITHREESGEGKFQLFDPDGKPVDYFDGVHYLTFLKRVAHEFDPSFYSSKLGRGFQAREYYNVIKEGVENAVST